MQRAPLLDALWAPWKVDTTVSTRAEMWAERGVERMVEK